MKSRSFTKIVAIISIVLLFCSCTKKQNPEILNNRLIIGISKEPESLNPLFSMSQSSKEIVDLIFRKLAVINSDLTTFTPDLAKNFKFSDDSLSITFNLRTDVKWHDGFIFSAQDVVFTYNMHINSIIAWDGISYKKNIATVTASNDSTVIFYFKKRSRFMLMDAVEGNILPYHILKQISPQDLKTSLYNINPIGCGPYKISGWVPQQYIILDKNNNYYKKDKPHINKVIFKIVPDNTIRFSQLLAGEIDFVQSIDSRNYEKLIREWQKYRTEICPMDYNGRDYDFIGWNLIDSKYFQQSIEKYGTGDKLYKYIRKNKFFGDRRVRLAISLAIDKQLLCQTISSRFAQPLYGPIIPIYSAFKKNNYKLKYNLNEAKRLLRSAGWRDRNGDGTIDKKGREFVFEMFTNSGNNSREQSLLIIQDQLQKLKIKMIPRIVESNYLIGNIIQTRNFDAILLGWSAGIKPDLTPIFHSSSFFHPFHFTGYYSPNFDSYNENLVNALSSKDADKHFLRVAKKLNYDLPYTWLYYKKNCIGIHKRFKNINFTVLSPLQYLEDWYVEPKNNF